MSGTVSGHTFQPVDYLDRRFDRFFVRGDHFGGPGWFVYGRNPAYGDGLIKVCAWPDKPLRRYAGWNGKVKAGWRTKREAQAIADKLNAA